MMINETEAKIKDFMTAWIKALNAIEKKYSSAKNDIDTEEEVMSTPFEDYVPDGFYDADLEELTSMSDDALQLELDELGYDDDVISRNINAITSDNVVAFKNKQTETGPELVLESTLMSELIRESIGKSFIYSRKKDTLKLEHSEPVRDDYVEKTNLPSRKVSHLPGRARSSRGGKPPRLRTVCYSMAASFLLTVAFLIAYKHLYTGQTTNSVIYSTGIEEEKPAVVAPSKQLAEDNNLPINQNDNGLIKDSVVVENASEIKIKDNLSKNIFFGNFAKNETIQNFYKSFKDYFNKIKENNEFENLASYQTILAAGKVNIENEHIRSEILSNGDLRITFLENGNLTLVSDGDGDGDGTSNDYDKEFLSTFAYKSILDNKLRYTIAKKVILEPRQAIWKKGTGPISRIDRSTGETMNLVVEPAKYKIVKKRLTAEQYGKLMLAQAKKIVGDLKSERNVTVTGATVRVEEETSEVAKLSRVGWKEKTLSERSRSLSSYLSSRGSIKPKGETDAVSKILVEISNIENTDERLNYLNSVENALLGVRNLVIEEGLTYNDKNLCSQVKSHEHHIRPGDTLYGVIANCGYNIEDSQIFQLNGILHPKDILIFKFDEEKTIYRIDIERVGSETIMLYESK